MRVADWAPFPAGGVWAVLTFVEVELGDGATDLYFVPLLTGPDGEPVVADALAEEAVRAALLEAIAGGRELATHSGRVRAFPTTAFAELRGRPDESRPAVLAPPTSSNSLIRYGRRLLLKVFRRLEPGINPDLEIGRFLTEKSGFRHIPRVAGGVEYLRPGSEPVTLAVLQEQIAHQGDGWTHTLEGLTRLFGRVPGDYGKAAAALGRRTAELHLALADDRGNPAFTPEPLATADLEALTADSREQVRRALTALRGGKSESRNQEIEELLESLKVDPPAFGSPTLEAGKIRCHGDYHLGQVLCANDDFILLDFEGEPTRTIGERRAKQSPLKDVAGMLRSFDYAAHAGLFALTRDRSDDFDRLALWAEAWRRGASDAFLRAYRATAAEAAFLPKESATFKALLDAFVLNKALYELVYELNNRPDWVRIPVQGIVALLGRRTADPAPTKG